MGRGGRDRRIGSPAERARLNVTRAVRKAIANIARHDEPLGQHLADSVHTGRMCVYRPDPAAAVSWTVTSRKPRVRLERRFQPPETLYASSGDVSIAYQVLGDGPMDVVLCMGWVSHLDFQWADPTYSRFLRRLAAFGRLIVFDKRGTGLSDPVGSAPTFEERMDDIRAVMDATGSERAALIGYSEGGSICALFAATYPQRVSSLVLYDAWAVGPLAARELPAALHWTDAFDRIGAAIDHWVRARRWSSPLRASVAAPSSGGSGGRSSAHR